MSAFSPQTVDFLTEALAHRSSIPRNRVGSGKNAEISWDTHRNPVSQTGYLAHGSRFPETGLVLGKMLRFPGILTKTRFHRRDIYRTT